MGGERKLLRPTWDGQLCGEPGAGYILKLTACVSCSVPCVSVSSLAAASLRTCRRWFSSRSDAIAIACQVQKKEKQSIRGTYSFYCTCTICRYCKHGRCRVWTLQVDGWFLARDCWRVATLKKGSLPFSRIRKTTPPPVITSVEITYSIPHTGTRHSSKYRQT